MDSTGTTPVPVTPAPTVVRGASAAGIHRAREAARAFTARLHPPPDQALTDTLALVVCELVTNALRHGGGRYTLRLSAGPHSVTASVSDPSPALPRGRTADLTGARGGFGWHMVRRLTSHLAITRTPAPGKTIHARLPR
ncbi:ATP-binding protein [Streptomyces sp. NPDC006274]|uniref:ATP-binding protein n=1 Tax=unclassified Streptomyces TaxID=2593676 RepID=UPI0033BE21D4